MEPIEPGGLRAHLLDVEPPNVERLRVLQQELQAVFTQELTRRGRVRWSCSLVASLALAGFGWYVASHITAPESVASPQLLTFVWTVYTFAMLASALYAALNLWRGHVDLRGVSRRHRARLAVNVVIAVLLVLQAIGHPTVPMLAIALFGVVFLILAATRLLSARIADAELATREAMLRIELRLAERADAR